MAEREDTSAEAAAGQEPEPEGQAVAGGGAASGQGRAEPVELFALAMAGRSGQEVAAQLRTILGRDALRPPAQRAGDWREPPEVEAAGEMVRVSAVTARPEVLVLMLAGAGGRRIRVCTYPDREALRRWGGFRGDREPLPSGVELRLVGAWGGPPRVLMPTVAAAVIALSLERLGVLVWQAALALFVLLEILVLALAGRAARLRVEWYRLVRKQGR
ncbi:MAG: hypothetical protein KatS3mg102_0147 [Planctomycetota bacterium]|nr:MAG: hypothetical protein KatS3mg102_0147 [Planctomycetota bacterium]